MECVCYIMLELFDPKRDYVVRQGILPHWFQAGVTYFVTFRTDDSVPQSLLRSWHRRRDEWLRRHHIDPSRSNWKSLLSADPELDREYDTQFTRAFMAYLDRGYGACELRARQSAEIVASALRHFDGERYGLSEFVVMPNHVHALLCLLGDTKIETQCRSWKKFSAGEINRLLDRSGRFWQEESIDHLVRSVEQYENLQRYIAENPIKAGLREGEYLYWQRPM